MKATYTEIEESKRFPKGVFHCSPTNSTAFTNCCSVAICGDEQKCPKCGCYVVGWDKGSGSSRDDYRFNYAYRRKK